MKKKIEPVKIEPTTIELAIAAHVYADGFTTVEHNLNMLLEKIKKDLGNAALTVRDIKQAIADWLIKGYAVIKDGCLRINRCGRVHIETLAEVATDSAPAPLSA
jgi:hypothetical protein